MSWFCSLYEKSFSRKDSMQRHLMSKHRNAGLIPLQTVLMPSRKMSAVSLRASFHLHDCWNDRVWKNGLDLISITASFRGHLPSPGQNYLVLFTMAVYVYRNDSGHATRILTTLEQDSYLDVNKRNLIVFDDQMIDASKDKRIVNLFTRGSHNRNLSVIYIVQNLLRSGERQSQH